MSSFKKGDDYIQPYSFLCYTDSSGLNDHIGSGFIIYETDNGNTLKQIARQSFHLQDYNMVYQAEVNAIMQAGSYMLQNKGKYPIPPCTVFMMDSMSALQMLKKHSNVSCLANQCIAVLKTLSLHTNVTLRWIKAHVGHTGNEKADEHWPLPEPSMVRQGWAP